MHLNETRKTTEGVALEMGVHIICWTTRSWNLMSFSGSATPPSYQVMWKESLQVVFKWAFQVVLQPSGLGKAASRRDRLRPNNQLPSWLPQWSGFQGKLDLCARPGMADIWSRSEFYILRMLEHQAGRGRIAEGEVCA